MKKTSVLNTGIFLFITFSLILVGVVFFRDFDPEFFRLYLICISLFLSGVVVYFWNKTIWFVLPLLYLGFPVIAWLLSKLNFDFYTTILLLIPLIIHIAVIIVNKKMRNKSLQYFFPVAFCIFYLYLFLSLLWSPNREYGLYKLSVFGIMAVAPAIILFSSEMQKNSIRYFSLGIQLTGLLTSVLLYFFGETVMTYRDSLLGANPIWLSRIAILAIVVSILNLSSFKGVKRILINGFIILACLRSIIVTGSRGPVVAFILAVVFAVVFAVLFNLSSRRFVKIALLSIISGLTLIVPQFLLQQFPDWTDRYLEIFKYKDIGGTDGNIIVRADYLAIAYKMFKENFLFGSGSGGFSYFSREYPHNSILEILSENGLIGFLLFMIIIIYILINIIRSKERMSSQLILFGTVFICSLFSGDLSANYEWVIIGSLIVCYNNWIIKHGAVDA